MSRVGKKPIVIPEGVEVAATGPQFAVKGKLGQLECVVPSSVDYTLESGVLTFSRRGDKPQQRSDHGLARALVNNMIVGVTQGFSKILELEGTGYKWEAQSRKVVMQVGFSHPVVVEIPDDIKVEITGMRCTISGIDKQRVGFYAAQIRQQKPVEPYKGKGVHYQGEFIRRKAGKAGA